MSCKNSEYWNELDKIFSENCIYPCGCCDDCPELSNCDAPLLLQDLDKKYHC